MSIRQTTLLMVLAAAVVAPLARAQSPDPGMDDLRRRIEALERENIDLRQTMVQRLPGEFIDTTVGVYDASSAPSPVLMQPASAGIEQGYEVGKDLAMTARWNNGLELSTADKAFRTHIGGRWQMDTSWFSADQSVQNNLPGGVNYHDGIDFRRARLRIDGTMYETIEYAMEYDFVNGLRTRNAAGDGTVDQNVTAITDLWLQFSHMPAGNLRIGNQKEPIGFEHIVSSRYLPFLERSYNQDTFYGGSFNGFTPGIALWDSIRDDRASYSIGLYKPTNNVFGFNNNDGDYAVTGRVTALPWYVDEGRGLFHLGMSVRHATTYDDRIRFRTRDAIRAGVSTQWPVPADVTVLGDTMQWINTEVAAVHGPWTFQAEYLVSYTQDAMQVGVVAPPSAGTATYQGGYVQLLYYLTGESDRYSFEKAAFDRVVPHENFFLVEGEDCSRLVGSGAWQVGARYNYLDLNDQGINGGILHNFTAGVNWFLNPNTKMQFNYIATYRDVNETPTFPDGSGWIHGWGIRVAQDF